MNTKTQGRILTVLLVIFTYIILLLPHFMNDLTFSRTAKNPYQYLTAGFLQGQTSLSVQPRKELLQLKDPYDSFANKHYRLHDASLYHGKYYLYFGPLPVLTFFMPIKLLTDFYPAEFLGVLFYLALGFIATFLLLTKIQEKYFPSLAEKKFIFAAFLIGLANNSVFLLMRPKFYEVAISSAFCLMSFALLFLFQFLQRNFSLRYLFGFSTCLGLTVAGRMNFVVVCCTLIPLILLYLSKKAPQKQLPALMMALLLPIFFIGTSLAVYNYLRFDSIWEFGNRYQLSLYAAKDVMKFTVANWSLGIHYYLFQKIVTQTVFPYLSFVWIEPMFIQKRYFYEASVGIFLSQPFLVFTLLIPFLLLQKKLLSSPLAFFTLLLALIPTTIFLVLITISFANQRYFTDFIPYLVSLSVIGFWLTDKTILQKIANFIFFTLGFASLFVWANLGTGNYYAIGRMFSHYLISFGSHTYDINVTDIFFVLVFLGMANFIFKDMLSQK
jgi:hypothetical protein